MLNLAWTNFSNARISINKFCLIHGTVYNLDKCPLPNADYVICRNALHRFIEPEKALKQMIDKLNDDGVLYIRDLKRNADWETILKRIDDKRWETPSLVLDYIGAMASMLTTEELVQLLVRLGITNYEISDGDYRNGLISSNPDNLIEFEKETEYVAVIRK